MRSVALLIEPGETPLSADGLAEVFRAGALGVTTFDISRWREPGSGDTWNRAVGGHDRIVAVGGDAAIGLAGRVAAETGLPLAVIPGGHSNVFADALGLPLDIERSVALSIGTTTRTTRFATVGQRPFARQASVLARWVVRRKPYPSRILLDGEVAHDGDTLALQVLPPPAEDSAGGLVARFTTAEGGDPAERRCTVVEAHVPADRMLDVDGEEIPAVELADDGALRFALTEPFELVVAP